MTDLAGIFTLDATAGEMTCSGGEDGKHLNNVKLTYEQSSSTDNVQYDNMCYTNASWVRKTVIG